MTPMQSFAIGILKERGTDGLSGSHLASLWVIHKGGHGYASSRRMFGATSAAYRTLRALVAAGLCTEKATKTSGGYTNLMYYALQAAEPHQG